MASILRDKGYVTAAFTGSGPISAKFGFYKGFDSYNETTSYLSGDRCDTGDIEKVFHKSMQWLNGNKNRTFFLFLHTYEAHRPYCDQFFVNEEEINRSDPVKYRTALYDGDIRQSDFFVGKVIEKLNELRLTDNTIVVVTSDHGEDLGDRNPEVEPLGHGHSLYDELLLIPLIFYNPIIFPQGERVDYQVRSIDILPTILEYLGHTEEASFQGKSLKGMIEGYDRRSRPAYSEATTYGTERESVRDNGYKYIYRISYGQLSDPIHRTSLTPLHELYDLNVDPGERVNLAEERKDIVEKKQKLILSIFPERTLKDYEDDVPIRSIDISKNKELIENIKSLGYIQ
jgi:arylsulfatase A-like enzyme